MEEQTNKHVPLSTIGRPAVADASQLQGLYSRHSAPSWINISDLKRLDLLPVFRAGDGRAVESELRELQPYGSHNQSRTWFYCDAVHFCHYSLYSGGSRLSTSEYWANGTPAGWRWR
jgi:hypothetical protein